MSLENKISYTPDYELLKKFFGTFNDNIFAKLLDAKSMYSGIQLINKEKSSKIDMAIAGQFINTSMNNLYWICSYLPSRSFLESMDDISNFNKDSNCELLRLSEYLSTSTINEIKFIVSKDSPVSITSNSNIEIIRKLILSYYEASSIFKDEYKKENQDILKNKSNFLQAETSKYAAKLDAFLKEIGIKTANQRHIIIGKVFYIANLPFMKNTGQGRKPINALGPHLLDSLEKKELKHLVDAVRSCLSRASQ